MDRGAWWATAHGADDSDTTEQLTHTSSKGKQPCLKQSTPCKKFPFSSTSAYTAFFNFFILFTSLEFLSARWNVA